MKWKSYLPKAKRMMIKRMQRKSMSLSSWLFHQVMKKLFKIIQWNSSRGQCIYPWMSKKILDQSKNKLLINYCWMKKRKAEMSKRTQTSRILTKLSKSLSLQNSSLSSRSKDTQWKNLSYLITQLTFKLKSTVVQSQSLSHLKYPNKI